MGDSFMSDEEIDEFCTCTQTRKDTAIEFQIPKPDGPMQRWHTVFYVHKDCPLHGMIRLNYTHAAGVPNAGNHTT